MKLAKRVFYKNIEGEENPTIVFVAGIHGNEPAAVDALESVFHSIKPKLIGNVYALLGNIEALKAGTRYIDCDLNRLWTLDESFESIRSKFPTEAEEYFQLKSILDQIIEDHGDSQLVVVDLHTTSSESCPFMPFNDLLSNRDIAKNIPVPKVTGIEEFIRGPMTSYINDKGIAGVAFEAGKHEDPKTVDLHTAFIMLCLHQMNITRLNKEEHLKYYNLIRERVDVPPHFYEIIFRYGLTGKEDFEMIPGFKNFSPVNQGQLLAHREGIQITSPFEGLLFMPSYQKQSLDGFFIVEKIGRSYLFISGFLRRILISRLIVLLPGIKRVKGKKNLFYIPLGIFKFVGNGVFKFLGYRIVEEEENGVVLVER